jgi:predicted MFS family arabinose efflux permease
MNHSAANHTVMKKPVSNHLSVSHRATSATGTMLPVVILALGTFATGTDAFIIAGILPAVGKSLSASLAEAGQMVTLFAFTYGIGSPVLTTLMARVPRRQLLMGSMALFALANVLAAVSPNIAVFAVARFLTALLAGIYTPAATIVAAGSVPAERRGRALAIVLGGASVATVIGVPLGLQAATYSTWRASFLFVAVLAAAAVAGLYFVLSEVPLSPKVSLRQRVALLRSPAVLIILMATVASMSGGFAIYTYIVPTFASLGGGATTITVLTVCFGAGGLFGSWAGGHGCDRWGPLPVSLTAMFVFTANHALLPHVSHSSALAFVYMAVWGACGWGFVPPQQHRLITMVGPDAPIVVSLNASALYLGIGLGSLIGGAVIASSSGVGGLWVVATAGGALAFALTVLSVWVGRSRSSAARHAALPVGCSEPERR